MKTCLLLAVSAAAAVADPPCISFTKSFPGSKPPWVGITLHRDGKAEYREAPDDNQPVRFQMPEADTAAMFALAEKLEKFTRPIESGLKVANMGEKTFEWQAGAEKHSVKFNYSQDLDAQQLLDWFERISETERHLLDLERTVRFDRLGVNQALLQLQISWERKRLVAPEQFLKLLERVVKNEGYMNIARERAAMLADAFRAAKAQ